MSLARFAKRRDRSEPAIKQALEAVGAKVLQTDVIDLIVRFRGQTVLLEVKTPKIGRPTTRQRDLVEDGWPIVIVRCPEDALKAIGL